MTGECQDMPVDYLSGPMSGQPYFNIPAFDAAAADLRGRGRKVISPAELDDPEFRALCLLCVNGTIEELTELCKLNGLKPETWGDLLARDIKLLANDGIENIVCLPRWTKSRGARGETFFGRLLDLNILSYPSLQPVSVVAIESAHGAMPSPIVPRISDHPPIPAAYVEGETVSLVNVESNEHGQVKKAEGPDKNPIREASAPGGYCATDTTEIRVADPVTGGEKGEKQAVLGDLDPRALMEVGKVAGFGRKKYERLNFAKGYRWSLSYDACQRHLHQFWSREELDDETGLHHLAAAAWHCLTLLCFVLRKLGTDDRMV